VSNRTLVIVAAVTLAGVAGFVHGWRRETRREQQLARSLWAARQ